jgi:amino acid transporter
MTTIEQKATNGVTPKPTLTVIDAIAVIVGIVIGSGVFKAPSTVAANSGDESWFLLFWIIGGFVSFVGALCYTELASTYPHAGGEYHYLQRAFGQRISFLYAWARLTIIQTGSIATVSFVFGDYATQIFSLGFYSSSIYAGLAVLLLTWIHSRNINQGTFVQILLSTAKVLGLICVIVVGISFIAKPVSSAENTATFSPGIALVFVLFAYGGWSEVSFITAEMKDVRRNVLRALFGGIAIITTIYVLTNIAYLKGLGFQNVIGSETVAADLMRNAMGESGAKFISILIAIATLCSASGSIFTGARTNYAVGKSFSLFSYLGEWNEKTNTPRRALFIQCLICFLLIFLGSGTRNGFETLVIYTTPAYYFFLTMTGVSLFVLRVKDKNLERPFHTPLFPVTPLIFIAATGFVLFSTVMYAYSVFIETSSKAALTGIIVLLLGIPVMFFGKFNAETRP